METKLNFFDYPRKDLQKILADSGKEKYRATQLYQWVYQKRIEDPSQMSNLGKSFREEVSQKFDFSRPKILKHAVSTDGTQKFLFDVGDQQTVESVLIPSNGRLTLCVSSEVGCNMACRFCYTAKQKLKKRLSAAQIVGQFLGVMDSLEEGQRISNIVFMGMGEPLDNPDAVFGSIEVLHDVNGISFSKKRVTVSTSGLIPMIPKVAESGVRLAVSLNATTNETRDYIMPINKRYPMMDLLEACKEYARVTNDAITFEYVLLKGVTDSVQDAKRLAQLMYGIPNKINVIPFNEHPNSEFTRPSDEEIQRFMDELTRRRLRVYLRRTMGRDIYAACGQLRTQFDKGRIPQALQV